MTLFALTALVPLFRKTWLVPCELPNRVKADALAALKGMPATEDVLVVASVHRLLSALAREITPGQVPQIRTDLGRVITYWRGV